MPRSFAFIVLTCALLSGCAAPPMEWNEIAQSRTQQYSGVLQADRKAPPSHRQMAQGVLTIVNQCALDRSLRLVEIPQEEEERVKIFIENERQCARQWISQALVVSGPDQAYEASIAAKALDPSWFTPVIPSHMRVD